MPLPEGHLIVCTGSHCRKRGGKKLCKRLRKSLEDHGLKRRFQVVETDCLKQCSHGPMALIYPDRVWYAGLEPRDAPRVVEEHLMEGKPVAERLYRRAHKS